MKSAGDRAELGDTLGHPMEPYIRWARLVGIRKVERDTKQQWGRFIVRMFKDGDGWYPTGEYRQTNWLVAWGP